LIIHTLRLDASRAVPHPPQFSSTLGRQSSRSAAQPAKPMGGEMRRLTIGRACAGAVLLAMLAPAAAYAREAAPGAPSHLTETTPAGPRNDGDQPAATADHHRLPPESTTRHKLVLPDRTLAFTATAGAIRIFDDKGEP